MGHTKGAVDTTAVVQLSTVRVSRVASVAHVCRAKAVPHRNRAAIAALPIDVSFAVLRTLSLAGAIRLQLAILTAQIFLLGVFL